LPPEVKLQKLITGAERTTLLLSPVKLNEDVKVAAVCGMPEYVPVPFRKLQFGLKDIMVNPAPLGPDAVVLPPNAAEPVIIVFGTARSWSVEATAKSRQPNSDANLVILVMGLIVYSLS